MGWGKAQCTVFVSPVMVFTTGPHCLANYPAFPALYQSQSSSAPLAANQQLSAKRKVRTIKCSCDLGATRDVVDPENMISRLA